MKRRHTAEQIVAKPRQADLEFGKGLRVPEVCKRPGISEQTYYRWRTKYGGMDPQIARQRVVRLFQDDHVGQPVPRALGAMIGDASGMPMQGMPRPMIQALFDTVRGMLPARLGPGACLLGFLCSRR